MSSFQLKKNKKQKTTCHQAKNQDYLQQWNGNKWYYFKIAHMLELSDKRFWNSHDTNACINYYVHNITYILYAFEAKWNI